MHVNNVAVHPQFRRRGFAEMLLDAGFARGRERGARTVYLEVRRSNEKAVRLYEKLGFREAGVRRKYYSDNGRTRSSSSVARSPGRAGGHGGAGRSGGTREAKP